MDRVLSLSRRSARRNATMSHAPRRYFFYGYGSVCACYAPQLQFTLVGCSVFVRYIPACFAKGRRPTSGGWMSRITKSLVRMRSLMNSLYREKCSPRFNFLVANHHEKISSFLFALRHFFFWSPFLWRNRRKKQSCRAMFKESVNLPLISVISKSI